jgi:ABC-type nitrate/sulfonate/bicarbonate transport system substrate-binding protein
MPPFLTARPTRRILLIGSLAAAANSLLAACGARDATPVGTAAAAVTAIPGTTAQTAPTTAPATIAAVGQSTIKAKLGIVTGINSADVYLAQVKGFYSTHGIDAELITFQSATVQRDALISGDIDLSAQAPFHVYLAQAKGTPLKIVGNRRNIVDIALVVRRDLADKVKQTTDLKGHSLAVSAIGAWDWAVANTYLKANGLDAQNDIRFVGKGTTTALTLFKTKQVDAAAINPPDLTDVIAGDAGTYLINPADEATHLRYFKAARAMSRAWLTHQRVIDGKPDAIAGVIAAADDAFRYFHQASVDEVAAALLPKFDGTSLETLKRSIGDDLKAAIPAGVIMSRAAYAADQQVFIDGGLTTREIPFDIAVEGRWAHVTD